MAGKVVGVNSAGTAFEGKTIGASAFASQAEAIAGTNNTKWMSPFLLKKLYDSLYPSPNAEQLLVKKVANNSAYIDFNEFNSTVYADYRFVFVEVIPVVESQRIYIKASDDSGSTFGREVRLTAYNYFPHGNLSFLATNFHADKGCPLVGASIPSPSEYWLQNRSTQSPLNYVRIQMGKGSIKSGSISLYGVRP